MSPGFYNHQLTPPTPTQARPKPSSSLGSRARKRKAARMRSCNRPTLGTLGKSVQFQMPKTTPPPKKNVFLADQKARLFKKNVNEIYKHLGMKKHWFYHGTAHEETF